LCLTRFGICIASILTRVIEYSERVGDTHEDESESDEAYNEYRSSRTEVFFCPVPPPCAETHGDSEECVEDFYEEHELISIFIILQEPFLVRLLFVL